jgi:hypothetical protein
MCSSVGFSSLQVQPEDQACGVGAKDGFWFYRAGLKRRLRLNWHKIGGVERQAANIIKVFEFQG